MAEPAPSELASALGRPAPSGWGAVEQSLACIAVRRLGGEVYLSPTQAAAILDLVRCGPGARDVPVEVALARMGDLR